MHCTKRDINLIKNIETSFLTNGLIIELNGKGILHLVDLFNRKPENPIYFNFIFQMKNSTSAHSE
jgi:hypothetical protein